MSELVVRTEDGVGMVTLNRPEALNALSLAMIEDLTSVLRAWIADEAIGSVRLDGAGDRGLCAGADVRALRAAVTQGEADPRDFLRREYELDLLIATYPKPVTALQFGIVMGGGLGLSAHASRRLVRADTRVAMPETQIGIVPDVGVSWLLARAPGELGTHLALTGATVPGGVALAAGLSDAAVDGGVATAVPAWMGECYQGDDAVEIAGRLSEHADPAAREAGRLLASRCPLAVVAALRALRNAATMTLPEVFAQDLAVCGALVQLPDFAEGVRAQLVDKDRRPRWTHATLAEVDPAEVDVLFA